MRACKRELDDECYRDAIVTSTERALTAKQNAHRGNNIVILVDAYAAPPHQRHTLCYEYAML